MQGTRKARIAGRMQKLQLLLLVGIGMVAGSLLSSLLTTPAALYAQTSSPLTIQPDTGMVGIGTTTPGSKLDVVGGTIRVRNGGSGAPGVVIERSDPGGVQWKIMQGEQSGAVGSLEFRNATAFTAPHLVLNPSGNVGIGTTNPVANLDVNGNGSSASLRLANSSQMYSTWDAGHWTSTRLTFQSRDSNGNLFDAMTIKAGNVGIGTTSPDHTLTVSGSIRATSGTAIYQVTDGACFLSNGILTTASSCLARTSCGRDGQDPCNCQGTTDSWSPRTCANTVVGRLVAP